MHSFDSVLELQGVYRTRISDISLALMNTIIKWQDLDNNTS